MPTRKSKKEGPPRYTVLRDTGEHKGKGWWFEPSQACAGTEKANLFTGDYSLAGYYEAKAFVVERKGKVSEFVGNLTNKEKWDDFKQELERLEEFALPFVVCEFPYSLLVTYPRGSDVPRRVWPKIRVSPQFLVKRFWEIQVRFKTRFIFTDGDGRDAASSLFKRITELWPVPPPPASNASAAS